MSNKILIQHCNIVHETAPLQRDGYVIIEGDIIIATGSMEELPSHTISTVLDGSNKLLIAGLINGHNHSAMTLFRGMADDMVLNEWLHNHIFPAEANHVTEEMVYWCSKLAAAEMLLSGTTCVADGYFFSDQTAMAFEEAGIRAVVAHGILDFPAPGVADPSQNIATVDHFIQRWNNRTPIITPAVFAHSPYTCSPATLERAKQLADSHYLRFFIHLAESRHEQQMLIKPAGDSPVKHLHNLGILDSNCVAVHTVWLDDEDLDILAESGAHVILCPQSNFKLASGYSRAVEMQQRKIDFGLGTDGCASNNSLDMFREMDLLAKSQKVRHLDPTVFPAKGVYLSATVNNSRALGLDFRASIAIGNKADLVLIDLNAPHLTPFYNEDLLVYGVRGSDVDTVIVNGRIVVKDKKLISFNIEETKMMVRGLARKLSHN